MPAGLSGRLDRALAAALPEVSRSRLQALIANGSVRWQGAIVGDPAARPAPGVYVIDIPAPEPAEPEPEPLPLKVLFEDADLIVIDKPAGMSAHPGPGNRAGTLVNALLHHCGPSLLGIGGVARPGIVHRLDKDTSGVMVAAKTERAHRGLAAQFAAHDIERAYVAFTRGAPKTRSGNLVTRIGRSPRHRQKMAVLARGGREARTHWRVERIFGPPARPTAARVRLTLDTGRTHQIRVHLAHLGAPCLGDAAYGAGAPAPAVRAAMTAVGLERQALHAQVLGFEHPSSGEAVRFVSPLPEDLRRLEEALQKL
ncbi:MAG TPA: RluA family pseudouridine synthase [Caulobacteraceae bacterium]|nr:RluA family pseudouridine synthase [Caulobacteraceae bacterium]